MDKVFQGMNITNVKSVNRVITYTFNDDQGNSYAFKSAWDHVFEISKNSKDYEMIIADTLSMTAEDEDRLITFLSCLEAAQQEQKRES